MGGFARVRVAALAALALALAGLTVTVTGLPASAGTVCVDTVHPLGQATGWTEFVEGDGHRTSESEGSVAYGGNLPTGMTVGSDLTVAKTFPTLVVAGSHGEWFNLNKGSAYVVPKSGVNHNSGGSYLSANPIDFATAFAQLRAASTQWGAAAATGTLVEQSDVVNRIIVLRGSDPKLNVFTLTQSELTAAKTIAYDVPTGAAVLVNVRGASVSITSKMTLTPGGAQPTTAGVRARGPFIWNFPEATSLRFDVGSDFGGHVIAPRADVTVQLGVLVGQVVAKSFRSPNETHVAFLPATVCLPGTTSTPTEPEAPEQRSDVSVAKTVSTVSPRGGDQVTYTLTARNLGAAAATGVVVRDVLPVGVTLESLSSGCTVSGRTVTCAAGTLAPGASRSYGLAVTADPVAGAGASDDRWALHELTPTKHEWQVDLEPGETRTVSVGCPRVGAILSDGQLRVDHVDQGTGALTDVRVLRQESTGLGTWKAVVRNDAAGRAQAKAFVVCLPPTTEVTQGHRHALDADTNPVTASYSWAAGRRTATLSCPTGTVPIVPGYTTTGGAPRWSGSEPVGATGWRFVFDLDDATTVVPSLRCLRREVSAADGHTHDLALQHVARTVTVPPGAVVEEQVICSDLAKGITATWSLPAGVVHLGNDPRLKARAFRLLNTTGSAQQVLLDLECLGDRPGPEVRGHDLPVVVDNTATVTSTSEDANPANNSASVSMSVQPGAVTATALAAAGATAKVAVVRVVSSMPGTGTVVLRSGRTVLAQGKAALRAGTVTVVTVKLTKKGRKAFRKRRTARVVDVVVTPARGARDVRRVVLRRS
ncbi:MULTISPECIES: choice-of-anchor A family protein [unclassified Nocardioides]|uniref:choice-of-anchor A family protein n=1 Tax=unclassified Nocardioides TaxID=2615069 RepID=UPI003014DB9F